MTATSVTSVSASPPSLLVCINQKASLYETIAQAGLFCVNILKVRQVEVGKTFAGALPRRERFAVGEWNENAFGLPVLAGAQAAISCRVAESMSYGTHAIFVGQLLQTSIDELIAPLLYADGRFSSLRETA
jgi:flavin reductase